MKSAHWLSPASKAAGIGFLFFLSACQDTPTTGPAVPGPQWDISEARFGNGNPDLFFGSPLASNPSPGDAGFEVGGAHESLAPYMRVCVTDGTESFAGCLNDVTSLVTGSDVGLALSFDPSNELYRVNWRTNLLDTSLAYRIEIWGAAFPTAARDDQLEIAFEDGPFAGRPRFLFGWRDILNSPSTAACTGAEEFCFVKFGQNLPVKVRIEDFVLCPISRDCAIQHVAAGVDANLEATIDEGPVQFFIPGQPGTDFTLAFEPCTASERAEAVAFSGLPTFGPCVKTTRPAVGGSIVLSEAALLSYCFEIDEQALAAQLAVPESQHELVSFHHFSTGGDPTGPVVSVEALPHTTPFCDEPTAGGLASVEEGSLVRLADAGKRLLSLFGGPQPLMAINLGGGTKVRYVDSYFMLALSAKFEYELPGDEFRAAVAGTNVTLRAKVTDLNGDPVRGAAPGWVVASSPAPGASVPAPPFPTTGNDGIAQVTVTLSTGVGDNVFDAVGRGIADDREIGCTLFGEAAGAASCNGPRAFFDPFQPNDENAVLIPDGTRLRFTVYGCEAKGNRTKCPGNIGG